MPVRCSQLLLWPIGYVERSPVPKRKYVKDSFTCFGYSVEGFGTKLADGGLAGMTGGEALATGRTATWCPSTR